MSMHRTRSPLLLLVPLLTLAVSGWSHEFVAAGLGVSPGMKPLNLSLPPQPAAGAGFGSSPPAGLDQGADLTRLPDLGQGSSRPADQGRGGRLPYGSGYEARQRAANEPSGTGFGPSGDSGGPSGGPSGGRLEGSRGGSAGGGFGGHQGAGGHGGGRR